MKQNNLFVLIFFTAFLLSCGGGGEGVSSDPDPTDHGPLAGTWQGEANNIIFTLRIDGNGQMYTGHIETNNGCYQDTSCAMASVDTVIELVCHGYSGSFYTALYLDGEYNGDKTIQGQIETQYCNNLDHPIVLNKISGIQ